MSTKKPVPFLHWLTRTQPIRIVFIHLVLPACAWSMLTLGADPPWDIIGWVGILLPLALYWGCNYWYWRVKLEKGTK